MNLSKFGKIEFYRLSHFRYKFGKYTIFRNGIAIGKIKNDETVSLKAKTGKQLFWVKINWVKSNIIEIDVKPDSTHKVVVEFASSTFFKELSVSLAYCIFLGLVITLLGALGLVIGGGLVVFAYTQTIKPKLRIL